MTLTEDLARTTTLTPSEADYIVTKLESIGATPKQVESLARAFVEISQLNPSYSAAYLCDLSLELIERLDLENVHARPNHLY